MIATTKPNNKKPWIKYPCLMTNVIGDPDRVIYMVGEKDGEYQGIALKHPMIELWDKNITGWGMKDFKPLEDKTVFLRND